MSFPIRLKTGFFETTAYSLSVVPGAIRLDPVDGTPGDAVVIAKAEITAIALSKKTRPGLTIHTRERTFTGAFADDVDRGELERQFSENLGGSIVAETN